MAIEDELNMAAQAVKDSIRTRLTSVSMGEFASYHQFLVPTDLIYEWHEATDINSAFKANPLTPYSRLDLYFIEPKTRTFMFNLPNSTLNAIYTSDGWQAVQLYIQVKGQEKDAHRLHLQDRKVPMIKSTVKEGRFGIDKIEKTVPSAKDLEYWKMMIEGALDYNSNPYQGFGLPIVGQSK